jgi:RHS repeat-associated protein
VRYLTANGHGSVPEGTVTDAYTYDAFGILIESWHLETATENVYLYTGEQWDPHLGMYYLRARYYHPDTGRFWTMDTFQGAIEDPLSLHKYLFAHANPANHVDPSGQSIIGELISMGIRVIVATLNIAGRVYPAAQFAALRIGYWYFQNQTRILMANALLAMGGAATVFLDAATEALLRNTDPVQLVNNNPGDWVQKKVGANATQYNIIDDFRDANATSIKTSQANMTRTLRELEKEARTMAKHNSPWKPSNTAPAGVTPIPIAATRTRTVLMIIPQNHSQFLNNPTFLRTVTTIHNTTGVILRVVPLRGWRR